MPELTAEKDIHYMREKLYVGVKEDKKADHMLRGEINKSLESVSRRWVSHLTSWHLLFAQLLDASRRTTTSTISNTASERQVSNSNSPFSRNSAFVVLSRVARGVDVCWSIVARCNIYMLQTSGSN